MAESDVELADRELEMLQSLAVARGIAPAGMTRRQLLEAISNGPDAAANLERSRRLAAVMSVHGTWKGDPDKPRDAVEYQKEIRAECP
ncbi:hypothetical protein ASF61_01700 [Duganella sp. Leaf126]|uniref:hypothetical protein n=1 Tax=Duganella sp. Leaf126 TaxID=1736266 RepID=UPI0007158A27|nr:hypothetical protein [Duganella sp. Leaf126]KQQ47390.1 hypothetical protein ASF61_01700 [Duganella sp. Leaf126]